MEESKIASIERLSIDTFLPPPPSLAGRASRGSKGSMSAMESWMDDGGWVGLSTIIDARTLDSLCETAATKFNVKPKSGIDFLISKKIICTGSPEGVSQFLLKCAHQISKRRLGQYLGGSKEFNQKVLECYLRNLRFEEMALDEALRKLITTFRLPGEAQQIDRILEKFAGCYHFANPSMFSTADTAYILSVSIIMLNTDLHNRNIAEDKRMTMAQFLKNNKGIDEQHDLPPEMLSAFYHRIKASEIRMNETDQNESDEVAFMAPTKAGWLKKLPQVLPGLIAFISKKKRWFVLTDGCLYYFKQANDRVPRGIIPLDNVIIERGSNAKRIVITSGSGGTVKSSKLGLTGNMKKGNRSVFYLEAESETERDNWVLILQNDSARFKPLQDIFLRLRDQKSTRAKGGYSEEALSVPPPLVKGWMKKRGLGSFTWTRRFFALIPDFDGEGPTLFYFHSREAAVQMWDLGNQTQCGYLRLRSVNEVEYVERVHPELPSIKVSVGTDNIVWTFSPEPDDEGYDECDSESITDASSKDSEEDEETKAWDTKCYLWFKLLLHNSGETAVSESPMRGRKI